MSDFKIHAIPGDTDLRVSKIMLDTGSCVAVLAGTLDGVTATDLDERLRTLLDPLPENFLLDLGDVDYLSSMGLSVVLKMAIKLKSAGSACLFYDPQLSVRRVLEISKWAHLILDPKSLTADSPFFGYVCDEEPARAARRNKSAASNPPRLFQD